MTKTIPLVAVLGHPVAHSLSPALFSYWLGKHGIRGHYVPVDVSADDLKDVLATMPRMGFVGCNVTIPHKERAIELAQRVTDRASAIGAANTLSFQGDGSILADNTDGVGFMDNVRQHLPDWAPQTGPAAVFGAGGAARAVIAALLHAGVPDIRLINRTRSRAEDLKRKFGASVTVFDWCEAPDALLGAATIVNTTSLGMTGRPPFDAPLDTVMRDAVATDLVYNPLDTDFLRAARSRGCRTVDGLGMLLHQAVPGFETWFGIRPTVDHAVRLAVMR